MYLFKKELNGGQTDEAIFPKGKDALATVSHILFVV
jgi:hypothetical protein